jgi:hypothetical protein
MRKILTAGSTAPDAVTLARSAKVLNQPSSTAALVALNRKLAKVSFALLQTNAQFVPAACSTA